MDIFFVKILLITSLANDFFKNFKYGSPTLNISCQITDMQLSF